MKNQLLIWITAFSLLSCGGGEKKTEPQKMYSQKMVESKALKTFLTNKREQQLKTAHWDYVSGLVAYGVLKAWQQYPEQKHYYDAVKDFADHCLQGGDTVKVGESNVDDIAAGKIFFTLYAEEMKKGNTEDAKRYKDCATFLRNKLKYDHSRIDSSKPGAGGFYHKAQYPNQMWLDGLYMGAAFYADWQLAFGEEQETEDNQESWTDIASQFKIIHEYTYDTDKKLNYHAWSADPTDANSFWARKEAPYLGCSAEFWGRGMGWYFAALVDVLEIMPQLHADYQTIVGITKQVAEGLALYQDEKSGCWYQLLQYDDTTKADSIGDTASNGEVYNICDKPNYLESSASSMFTYAYLKGMRIGVLDKDTYSEVANKAYQGLLDTFIKPEDNGDISIIQSCASAGLGPAKDLSRTGTVNYYLCGKDVTITQNEGKAIGPFIMASLEYELSTKK
ncbi:MAG: glycoside hydrolase family 88 protein [Dysgonomonas sp.]|nr:glycoside hydrolase family 88 protein [Dysgonomonas sp.]